MRRRGRPSTRFRDYFRQAYAPKMARLVGAILGQTDERKRQPIERDQRPKALNVGAGAKGEHSKAIFNDRVVADAKARCLDLVRDGSMMS